LSFIIGGIGIAINQNNFMDIVAYIQVWGIKLLNGGLFLGSAFGTIYFLKGTTYDVLHEIFEEHNIAASIFVGMYLLALAIVLTINS
jgi:Na+-transporting NADH:ubiquinone oxidoreductase subunit NqrB